MQWQRDEYTISDRPEQLDRDAIHGFLRESYWSPGVPRAVVDRVLPAHRGNGLGKWLIACVLAHPELQDLRRWMLATRDAHGLYTQNGFRALRNPERFMEINDPDIYKKHAAAAASG